MKHWKQTHLTATTLFLEKGFQCHVYKCMVMIIIMNNNNNNNKKNILFLYFFVYDFKCQQ